MKKSIRILSMVIVFLFLSTLTPWFTITAQAAEGQLPAADTAVTLVGNIISAAGLGDDWAPTNDKALMKEYKDGLYEITLSFPAAKADGEYKIAVNRSWNENYGLNGERNGANISINIPAGTKVIFRFDTRTHQIYDSINNPDKFKSSATLVGSFGNEGTPEYWNPSNASFDLDYIGGGFYKKTFSLKQGTYEYKVAYNHGWSNGEVGSNVPLKLDTDGNVTFLANPIMGVCTDSINNPAILGTVSLIGTIRGAGEANWTPDATGYEFMPLTGDGKFIYSGFFPAGTYEYKGIENYSWDGGGIPSSGNINLTVPDGGKYVVFVADRAGKKMYDSINNPVDIAVALGLQPPDVTVKSPVINLNGTVTFSFKDENAASVSLRGNMNGWGETPMDKNPNTGIWSVTLRLGDAAANYEYKFFINGSNWITDPANANTSNGNSLLEFPSYTGRKIVLAGTVQSVVGESTWNPSSEKTRLQYDGNGNYHIVIPNVPAGRYEYKVAMGSWDPENYGANGESYGPNMIVNVPSTQDVTFWYNDDSHYTVDSVSYRKLDIKLTGTGIPDGVKLSDNYLKGIYSARVTLSNGTYNDIKAVNVTDNTEHPYGPITINDARKDVTFSFDPVTGMVFCDASSNKIDTVHLYYNSRDIRYKSPYGAVPKGSPVTFNLQTGTDVTDAKLVLETGSGIENVPMTCSGPFDSSSNKWTVSRTFDTIGMYQYYFIVSNGADVKVYGDDDGYYGTGKAGNFGSVQKYGFNVYDGNFKTPDWMKNAVIYQIFPDRFFNGDVNNDYAQTKARGSVDYEFPSSWYIAPEDPEIEFLRDSSGNIVTDGNGKPVVDPNYKGAVGDGLFSNDMYGGDLKGVQAKLDYLQALGINVLYFNPVSQSISNHRYDTTDYRQVDPLLGHMEDFVNLANEAHKRGMHMILDGVFNHVSDDSIYFDRYGKYMAKGKPLGAYQYWSKVYDLMNSSGLNQQDAEKQVTADLVSQGITDIHYKDWFIIENTKVPATSNDPEHYRYEGWWGYDSMPVIQSLGGSEYKVSSWADEIVDGPDADTRYWLRQGSSGWRLDVANEVSYETWRHFREAVKQEGDNVIVGEIWDNASRYLLGDMYDSVMNYRFRGAVLNFVESAGSSEANAVDAVDAMNQLELIREQYPKEAFEALMNLVDSHDTVRAISTLDGYQDGRRFVANDPTAEALAKMRLIPLIQMTYPGAPTIYYGDEAGTPGSADPDDRRGMIWGKGNKSLVEWYAELANIRNTYPVLRTGDILPLTVDNANSADVMAYVRNDATDHALVVINRKSSGISGLQLPVPSIPDGTALTNLLNPAESCTVSNGSVSVDVPGLSGVILATNYKDVIVDTDELTDAFDPGYIVTDRTRVNGISFDKPNATVKVGETLTLNAVISPETATCKAVIWTSDNPDVAAVDANGTVTGNKIGVANITATTVDGNYKSTVSVAVVEVPVTEVRINKSEIVIRQGKEEKLVAIVMPGDASIKDVVWTSSNPGIVSVDKDGKLAAAKSISPVSEPTTVKITVTTVDGGYTATCLVTVLPDKDHR